MPKASESGPAWGTVSKVVGGVHVIAPTVAREYQLGPCEVLDHVTIAPVPTEETVGESTVTHPTSVVPLAVGDRVLVAFVNGSADHPVIIGRSGA